jgi:hypothetical protein
LYEDRLIVVVVVDSTGGGGAIVVDDVSEVVVVFTGSELQPAIKAVPASSATAVKIRKLGVVMVMA